MKVLAGHTAGGVITSTTFAGGLRVTEPFLNHYYHFYSFTYIPIIMIVKNHQVPGLPLAYAHHYPVVYGKREAEPQFFQ